jgi:hypothetical protein
VPKLLIYVSLFFGLAIQGIDIMRRRARGPIGLERARVSELLGQLSIDELRQALEQRAGPSASRGAEVSHT